MLFFFFKQKTAYEMRISDWSSDVCSSDLLLGVGAALRSDGAVGDRGQSDSAGGHGAVEVDERIGDDPVGGAPLEGRGLHDPVAEADRAEGGGGERVGDHGDYARTGFSSGLLLLSFPTATQMIGRQKIGRAHAELQSLMRISYAVFCL